MAVTIGKQIVVVYLWIRQDQGVSCVHLFRALCLYGQIGQNHGECGNGNVDGDDSGGGVVATVVVEERTW